MARDKGKFAWYITLAKDKADSKSFIKKSPPSSSNQPPLISKKMPPSSSDQPILDPLGDGKERDIVMVMVSISGGKKKL